MKLAAVGLLVATLALPVLYTLSVGPAARLAGDDVIADGFYFMLYDPLFVLSGRNEFLSRWLDRYIDWWAYGL